MSFKKLQLIRPQDIGCPEEGHIYLGRDEVGLWEKYPNCEWLYIVTGVTTGAGTSGTAGSSGSDGADGEWVGSSGSSGRDGSSGISGTSGSSGKSGKDGTSGSSGSSGKSGSSGSSGTSGSSGSSGKTGSSGTSGTSGTSGSSGVDGNFYGSSGSSGFSGGYGGATRKWLATSLSTPGTSGFYGTSGISPGSTSFTLLDKIVINKIDADGGILSIWLSAWITGLMKIENRLDLSIFGLYNIIGGSTLAGNNYTFEGVTCIAGNGNIIIGDEHLISFVNAGGTSGVAGTSGTSGSSTSGTSGTSGSSGLDGDGTGGSSGTSGSSGSSGASTDYDTDADFYYNTTTDILYTPSVALTNLVNTSENNTKLVLSGNIIKQVVSTGLTISDDYATTTSDTYIKVIVSSKTITLHDAIQSYQELKIKNASGGNISVVRQNSTTIDGATSKTLANNSCLTIRDGDIDSWDIISYYIA